MNDATNCKFLIQVYDDNIYECVSVAKFVGNQRFNNLHVILIVLRCIPFMLSLIRIKVLLKQFPNGIPASQPQILTLFMNVFSSTLGLIATIDPHGYHNIIPPLVSGLTLDASTSAIAFAYDLWLLEHWLKVINVEYKYHPYSRTVLKFNRMCYTVVVIIFSALQYLVSSKFYIFSVCMLSVFVYILIFLVIAAYITIKKLTRINQISIDHNRFVEKLEKYDKRRQSLRLVKRYILQVILLAIIDLFAIVATVYLITNSLSKPLKSSTNAAYYEAYKPSWSKIKFDLLLVTIFPVVLQIGIIILSYRIAHEEIREETRRPLPNNTIRMLSILEHDTKHEPSITLSSSSSILEDAKSKLKSLPKTLSPFIKGFGRFIFTYDVISDIILGTQLLDTQFYFGVIVLGLVVLPYLTFHKFTINLLQFVIPIPKETLIQHILWFFIGLICLLPTCITLDLTLIFWYTYSQPASTTFLTHYERLRTYAEACFEAVPQLIVQITLFLTVSDGSVSSSLLIGSIVGSSLSLIRSSYGLYMGAKMNQISRYKYLSILLSAGTNYIPHLDDLKRGNCIRADYHNYKLNDKQLYTVFNSIVLCKSCKEVNFNNNYIIADDMCFQQFCRFLVSCKYVTILKLQYINIDDDQLIKISEIIVNSGMSTIIEAIYVDKNALTAYGVVKALEILLKNNATSLTYFSCTNVAIENNHMNIINQILNTNTICLYLSLGTYYSRLQENLEINQLIKLGQ